MNILGLLLSLLLNASSYIVMDQTSNRVLEGNNYQEEKLIASTTKIMTSIIALENKDLRSKVIIDKDVLKAYGSNIYIEMNEEITLEDLLYGLMLRSGNDAAIEIANYVAGNNDNFVMLMNSKAKDLGMNNTKFINPSGLEDDNGVGNTSTAYDMALLMSYAINNKYFLKIIGTKRYITKTNFKTYDWYNKNKLLSTYKYCLGGKTGFTKKAKRTLVTAAKKDNKTLVVVTLNDPDDFNDHKYLYENNFSKYNLVTVLKKNDFFVESNIYYDELYIDNDVNILLTKEEEKKVKVSYEVNKIDDYTDKMIVGKLNVLLDGKIIASKNIYARKKEKIESKKSFLEKLLDYLKFWD